VIALTEATWVSAIAGINSTRSTMTPLYFILAPSGIWPIHAKFEKSSMFRAGRY